MTDPELVHINGIMVDLTFIRACRADAVAHLSGDPFRRSDRIIQVLAEIILDIAKATP